MRTAAAEWGWRYLTSNPAAHGTWRGSPFNLAYGSSWFPSVLAVYDAVFARGQRANLAAWRAGLACSRPGLPALLHGLTATARWAVDHPFEAQLLFWRPVPQFRPWPACISAC